MSIKCKNCGLSSDMDDAFKEYCPPCLEKRLNRAGILFTAISLLLLYILIFMVSPQPVSVWLLFNLVTTYLLFIPMIFLHEFAHACSGALMGMRIFSVRIGAGRIIFDRRFLGFELEWRILPLGGRIVSGIPPSNFARIRLFLQALSGPIVHIFFIAVPVVLYLGSYFEPGNYLNSPSPLAALLFCNLIMLAENLWPRRAARFGRMPSDGLRLLQIPFYDEKRLSLEFSNYYFLLASELLTHHQPDKALLATEKSLELCPDNPAAIAARGWTYFRLEDFLQARQLLLDALENSGSDSNMKFAVMNCIALTDIALANNGLLAEADHYSLLAYKNIPWVPLVAGTRGAALGEIGQSETGVKMLQTALGFSEKDDFDKAIIACLLAIAEKKRSNGATADQYLRMAESADFACPLLTNARNEKTAVFRDRTPTPAINDINAMEFTTLEQKIMDWFKNNYQSPELIAQIENAMVVERQNTSEGLFLELQVANSIPPVEPDVLKGDMIIGPRIISPEIDLMNSCDLFLKSGRLHFLRIFSPELQFPEELGDYELVDP